MRYLFYHYNFYGTLIIEYSDDKQRIHRCYLDYSLKDAIARFRKENDLRFKHITISKFY